LNCIGLPSGVAIAPMTFVGAVERCAVLALQEMRAALTSIQRAKILCDDFDFLDFHRSPQCLLHPRTLKNRASQCSQRKGKERIHQVAIRVLSAVGHELCCQAKGLCPKSLRIAVAFIVSPSFNIPSVTMLGRTYYRPERNSIHQGRRQRSCAIPTQR
jgi:hypothetical protein